MIYTVVGSFFNFYISVFNKNNYFKLSKLEGFYDFR